MNRIEISNYTIHLIHCIDIQPNPPSNNMLDIVDSGANIYLAKKATTTMGPVIIPNEMTARLVLTLSNTTDTRSNQASEADPHFSKNEDSPIDIIRSLM